VQFKEVLYFLSACERYHIYIVLGLRGEQESEISNSLLAIMKAGAHDHKIKFSFPTSKAALKS